MLENFNGQLELDSKTAEFFIVFSRFEFALKRGGFLAGNVGETATANWDVFGKKLGPKFYEMIKFHPQASVFFTGPPKKLFVLDDGQADFKHLEDVINNKTLFDALKRVRNNLFHGEKLWLGERDKILIAAALFVLDTALDASSHTPDCEQVAQVFHHARVSAY